MAEPATKSVEQAQTQPQEQPRVEAPGQPQGQPHEQTQGEEAQVQSQGQSQEQPQGQTLGETQVPPHAQASPQPEEQPQQQPHQDAIEADPNLDTSESDSALGDEVSKYTASLTSSIERYTVENGRRYHAYKDGSYLMPNDDSELDRLDLTHQMFRILLNENLHLAPVAKDKPTRIMDVGTGTGIWAIEMGDEYPMAEIIGTDLSPTQSNWVPPNVKFEVDDCEEPWTFQQPFDFIHLRYMAASLKDWPKVIRQCYENTVPGGWVEVQDFDLQYYSEDGSMTKESAVSEWANTLLKACQSFGCDPFPGPKIGGYLQDVGFQNIKAERFHIPIGPWPKDPHLKTLGSWNLVQIEDGLEGFTLRLYTQLLGWKPEEVQVLLAKVRKDLRNPRIHILYDFWVTYGQKPFTVSPATA